MAIGMVDMVQFAQDKKFTAFLLLLFLDLFMDGKIMPSVLCLISIKFNWNDYLIRCRVSNPGRN